ERESIPVPRRPRARAGDQASRSDVVGRQGPIAPRWDRSRRRGAPKAPDLGGGPHCGSATMGGGAGPQPRQLTQRRNEMADARTPTHAERSRTLAASRTEGALSTLALDPAGHPYGSYVVYAMVGASPVFLISKLAEHTKNLEADPRASLLVVEPEREGEEALARGRVTLVGECRP